MTDLMISSIAYDDIIAHWEDENWNGWFDVLWIESQIPGRKDGKYGFERIRDMTNNYIVEQEVARLLEATFFDSTHLTFHIGRGAGIPDLRLIDNSSAEIKRYKLNYYDKKWWNADLHLIYINKILYEQTPTEMIPLMELDINELGEPEWLRRKR